MSIRLSKSQLDKFQDCPRCFWLAQRHKLKQPEQISSKVWKGIERITIAHYEAHRLAKTTPPNLIGQVPSGCIPYQADRIDMQSLRYWGKGLRFQMDGIEVSTALDDMLQRTMGADGVRLYNVIDYKSKSKETDAKATADLYANQADVFDLAANVNNYPTDGVVYFDYWSPISVEAAERADTVGADGPSIGSTLQRWASQVIALQADHERCKKLVLAAAACIEGPMPDPRLAKVVGKRGGEKFEGCAVCAYLYQHDEMLKVLAGSL